MKKQILSAVLLTAMVGVSVAEAGFTDDLRAKLAGKDFTMQYVQKYDFANPNIADVGDKFTFTRQGKNFAIKHDFASYTKQGNVWELNGYTNHKAYMESINDLPNDYPYYDVRDGFMNSFYAEYDGWHYDVKTGYDIAAVVDVRGHAKIVEYMPVMCDSSTAIKILLLGENKGKLPKPKIRNEKYDGEDVVVEEYEIPLFEQDYNGVGRIIFYGHRKNVNFTINTLKASGGLVVREIKQVIRMYYRMDGNLVYFDAITSNPNGAKYRVEFINYRVDNSLFDYVKKFPVDKTKSKSLVKAQ